eukprot:5632568-Pyramimonas_sp.AAC.1
MGNSAEGPSAAARMRPPTQYSASWPDRKLHRRPLCYRPHAFPPSSTALRGPIGGFTEEDVHSC